MRIFFYICIFILYMENTQLLCTFAKSEFIDDTVLRINIVYTSVAKLFILHNVEDTDEMYCTYNVNSSELKQKSFLANTISVHRNKDTNTLYTINAVNSIVESLNDGSKNSSFKINWSDYKNSILVTNDSGLKKINTKLFKIIEI